jgi:Zn-dependent protease with chaperone function
MQNLIKFWIFVILFSIFFLFLGYEFGQREGLLLAFLASVGFILLMFFVSHNPLPKILNASPIKGQDSFGLQKMVQDFCDKTDLDKPQIFTFPHSMVNICCFYYDMNTPALMISTGALLRLDSEQLETMITHQLCQMRSSRGFTHLMFQLINNMYFNARRSLYKILGLSKISHDFMIEKAINSFAQFLLRMIYNPRFFMKVDAFSSHYAQKPHILAQILWKSHSVCECNPLPISPVFYNHFLVEPAEADQMLWFLKSHPLISKRIHRLIGYYPL